jgi:hypothetical protein
MERLYRLAVKLYTLRPWDVLEEAELVLSRDSATGETCYCSGRTSPREVRVTSRKLKDCLNPLSEVCGFPVKVVGSLPALAEAREGLMRMMEGRGY